MTQSSPGHFSLTQPSPGHFLGLSLVRDTFLAVAVCVTARGGPSSGERERERALGGSSCASMVVADA